MDNLTEKLPDRNDSDLPHEVQFVLSVFEAAIASYKWQRNNRDSPAVWFADGLTDYWWSSELEEPTFEMMFTSIGDRERFPSYKRFCYQQGAIVGYQLREEFDGPRG